MIQSPPNSEMRPPSAREKDAPTSPRERMSSEYTLAPDQLPPLHTKTIFAILAVAGIYFAQVYCLVGAGAVSPIPPCL